MPIQTELIISIGDILECLPPGKKFKKKRHLSFDENQALETGNEENVAPPLSSVGRRGHRCDSSPGTMKPKENGSSDSNLEAHQLPIRRTRYSVEGRKHCADEYDEDEDDDDQEVTFHQLSSQTSKPKSKRKSSAEKFLEDNSNYFQLEVLAAKTRSSKILNDIATTSTSEAKNQDFHNSFLDFLKSKGVEGSNVSDNSRSRHKSGGASDRNGDDYSSSPARSDSTDSARHQRGVGDGDSPRPHRARGHNSKPNSMSRLRSRSRDFSLSESEGDTEKSNLCVRRKDNCSLESSDDDSSNGWSEKLSKSSSYLSPSKRARRSELDKLLEAVDTSFHFETAAAAAKRLGVDNQSDLGPLEIDVSDSNVGSDEDSSRPQEPVKNSKKVIPSRKRKHSEIEGDKESLTKRRINRGNLLKTLSPATSSKSKIDLDDDTSSSAISTMTDRLADTDGSPINLEELYFSFECPPTREAWFQTYSRQDRGDDVVYYSDSKIFPFSLPYELPLSTFATVKPEMKIDVKVKKEKIDSDTPSSSKKGRKNKVSECESTDSENNNRRLKSKFGLKSEHLQDLHPRISPRCHASTKAVLHPGPLTDDDIIDGALAQEDPSLSFLNGLDETSNDSVTSAYIKNMKQESPPEDYVNVSSAINNFLRSSTGIPTPEANKSVKEEVLPNVPTRSRISSDQLLKNMKPKKKKIKSADVIMDNFLMENIDSVLLDLLEDELPTVPLELNETDTLSLVTSYQTCNSMNVCNSRWLRPSRPTIAGESATKPKAVKPQMLNSGKPKRLVIYKEDLPGFKFDNDIESEKLPTSRRMLAKKKDCGNAEEEVVPKEEVKKEETKIVQKKKKSPEKKEKKVIKEEKEEEIELPEKIEVETAKVVIAKKSKVKREDTDCLDVKDDDDNSSVASSTVSNSSRKKKRNKTGFPSVKKKKSKVLKTEKKEELEAENSGSPKLKKPKAKIKKVKEEKEKGEEKIKKEKVKQSPSPSKDKETNKSPNVKTKKKVLDRKGRLLSESRQSKHAHSSVGKRSATKSKNYSEIESDKESLLEEKIPYRSPHLKALLKQQQINSKTKSKSK